MEISMSEVIEYLTRKLGHKPTSDELCQILNGVGLIFLKERVQNEKTINSGRVVFVERKKPNAA